MNAIVQGPAIVRSDHMPKVVSVPAAGRLADAAGAVDAVWALAEESPVSVQKESTT